MNGILVKATAVIVMSGMQCISSFFLEIICNLNLFKYLFTYLWRIFNLSMEVAFIFRNNFNLNKYLHVCGAYFVLSMDVNKI